MTAGHAHRIVKVKRGGIVHRLLTRPTIWVTDYDRAGRSRFVYGETHDPEQWRLSPLGLLHSLTGLTLQPVEDGWLNREPKWAAMWEVEVKDVD